MLPGVATVDTAFVLPCLPSRRALRAARVLTRCSLALIALASAAGAQLGTVDATVKISDLSGGFPGVIDNLDTFGIGATSLGDLNGDGVPDMAVGASKDDDGGTDRGAVWILFLDSNGSTASTAKISSTSGGFAGPLDDFDRFGASVAATDLDGDGQRELIVGCNGDDDGVNQAGAFWVLFLDSSGAVVSSQKISQTSGGFSGTLDDSAGFGACVTVLGDIDDDGVPDIAAGESNSNLDDLPGEFTGDAWVMRLNADGTVKATQKISKTQGGFTGLLLNADGFGVSVGGVGDLDEDGVPDLAVGAYADDDGGTSGTVSNVGAVWILFLHTDGTVKSHQLISKTSGGFTGLLRNGDFFGRSVTGIGDLDGDGIGELAVGADGDDNEPVAGGAAWIVFLDGDGTVKSQQKITEAVGGFSGQLDVDDSFGRSIGWLPELGGTATDALLVGAPFDDDGGTDRGAVWVLFLEGAPGNTVYSGTSSLTGRPGRSAIVIPPPPPGDDEIDEPIIVVPILSTNHVHVEQATADPGGGAVFDSVGDFPTGDAPAQASTVDFNADQDTDAVTANSGDGTFSYLAGIGNGTFATHVDVDLPFDGTPISIGTADFDADGKADVAVAGDAGVTIFLGNGAGGFAFQDFVPVALLTDLTVGNVDGDADADIVVASGAIATSAATEQGFATVLLNDGTGNFAAGMTFASGHAVASVLLGSLDPGTTVDALLAVHEFEASPGADPVGKLLLFLGDGAGNFAPSGVFPGWVTTKAKGFHPTYGTLADIDHDNLLDAVYASSDNVSHKPSEFAGAQPPLVLTVLLNDGAGSFTTKEVGTAYVGKGVAPLLQQLVPAVSDTHLDAVLIWYADEAAGQEKATGKLATYLAVLAGDGEGGFYDPAPNQFVIGDGPGNPAVDDVNNDGPALGGTGGPDIVVPSLAGNSVAVLLGDGAGGVQSTTTIAGVDDLDPGSLPPGIWVGGPREAQLARLDAGVNADLAVYNSWNDTSPISPNPAVFASVSLYTGNGLGAFTRVQYLPLARGGEIALGDVTADGKIDLVVTQRLGTPSTDAVQVFPGLGNGTVSPVPQTLALPAQQALIGGLLLTSVDADADLDIVTACHDTVTLAGSLLVWVNTGGSLASQLFAMGASPDSVRSLDAGDLTGDAIKDIAIGESHGGLLVERGNGTGSFTPGTVNASAANVGGGALRVGNLNGDAAQDIVASSDTDAAGQPLAFVRTLQGVGNGNFSITTVGGVSSAGVNGALRPALADMNDDDATDTVLSHGTSSTASILLNALAVWQPYGPGKPGKGGITPTFRGKGYTVPGGSIHLNIAKALGGTQSILMVGVGQQTTSFFAVQFVLLQIALTLSGSPGVAGAGSFSLPATLPDDPTLLGVQITLQALCLDHDAGPPGPVKVSATNGLAFTIVN